jgi:NAD-dependent SIR2 family protein deacetylase
LKLDQNLLALDTSAATTRIVKMRVFVITGTGVSTESGPPILRGKDGFVDPSAATDLALID